MRYPELPFSNLARKYKKNSFSCGILVFPVPIGFQKHRSSRKIRENKQRRNFFKKIYTKQKLLVPSNPIITSRLCLCVVLQETMLGSHNIPFGTL